MPGVAARLLHHGDERVLHVRLAAWACGGKGADLGRRSLGEQPRGYPLAGWWGGDNPRP